MRQLYPLFADLANRPVLVVGGGAVAERKVNALLATGARITVGSPRLTTRLAALVHKQHIRQVIGSFTPAWLADTWLVIAATNDRQLNQHIARACTTRRLWVNVVDDASLCSFHVPALIRRGLLTIAISSAGQAPALARWVRAQLETVLDDALGPLSQLLADWRTRIRQRFTHTDQRRRFYDSVITGSVAHLLRNNQPHQARQALQNCLDQAVNSTGHVTLVGAGPGEAGLLTLNGLRALQQADVIVHDRLVDGSVLALARRDAEFISVGKIPGKRCNSQAHINALLREQALAGRNVVRLKGGDPFIFGRGGEELQYLRKHNIAYSVVPGITAANACAAYSGVPLTHRDHAQSVRFVTAHCAASLDTLDWQALAQEKQTLAVYMGVSQLATLRDNLIKHGRKSTTPFALIENGATTKQRIVTGPLQTLPELAQANAIKAPTLLILGEVAELATQLGWYGTQTPASLQDCTNAAPETGVAAA